MIERADLILKLFNDALEVQTSERAEFLSKVCGNDVSLRSEIESLLDSYNRNENLLQAPVFDLYAREITKQKAEEESPAAGKNIGAYRIIREIGRGGMGTVYLAERNDSAFKKQVAIKLLRGVMETDEIVRRFQTERQILADLEHPFIARLIDGGADENDVPYFVMEYVEGIPVDRYCEEKNLSIDERLELFRKICSAVGFAHENSVIHRDIKPSNILVTKNGTPKLLDFGIAKVLRTHQSINTTDTTATAFRVMTPDYASPEQIRGERIGKATDIYSLGVLLYKLLSGNRPYRLNNKSPYEIVQTICEEEPLPPSVASCDAETQGNGDVIGRTKNPKPNTKEHPLKGDLDNIVMMSLRKESERRYASVEQFSEDIRRYMEGFPIFARRDNLTYRGIKFIKRNRSYTYLTLAVILICLLLSVSFTFFTQSAKPKESIAVIPFINTSSDSNAEYLSDGITDSLIDTFSRLSNLSVPARSSVFRFKGQTLTPQQIGRDLNVETILTGNIASDGENLAIQVSLTNARSNQTIWNEQYVGKSSEILTLRQQIVRDVIRKMDLRLEIAEQKKSEKDYTGSNDAYHLYLKARYFWNQRREASVKNSLTFLQQAVEKDPNYALAYSGIADSYILLGLYRMLTMKEAFAEARIAAERALELDPQLAEAHNSMAAIKWLYDWDWAEADRQFRRAVEINPNSATAHHWYGLYLAEMGRFDEAVAIEKRAIQLDPLSVIINADLGRVLYYARRYDESIEQFQKAIQLDSPKSTTAFDITFVYEQKGMTEEWFSAMEQFGSINSHELRTAYFKDGIKSFWRKRVELSERQSRNEHFFGWAEDYARIGEIDRALEMLNRAFEKREHGMPQLKVNPVLDPLRSDPRFIELLKRMKLDN